jgi:hypothetical protein
MTELLRLLILLGSNSTKEVQAIVPYVSIIVVLVKGKYPTKTGKGTGVTPVNV